MAGRGRGGSKGGGSGVRAMADVLGIHRQDLASYSNVTVSKDPPPLFPSVSRTPLPLSRSDELQYLADVKQDLVNRMRESPFFLQTSICTDEIRRYTDKYRSCHKQSWQPDWSRIPSELCWLPKKRGAAKSKEPPNKRRKNVPMAIIDIKLAKLEEAEKTGKLGDEPIVGSGGEDGEEEKEDEKDEEEVSTAAASDGELEEEPNDYIESYFDPGDEYLNSDDNLEDENYS